MKSTGSDGVTTHYGSSDSPYEAIKVIEAWGLGFCLGNTVKYIARAGKKDDIIEDLKKAEWYLSREIGRLLHERIERDITDSYGKIVLSKISSRPRPRVRAPGRSHGKRPKRSARGKAKL